LSEAWEERQRAIRVLEAAVAEADEGSEGVVFALPVMRRAGLSNVEFRRAARYLDEQGWIAERVGDYEAFVVTPEGLDRVTRGRTEVSGTEPDDDSAEAKEDAGSGEDGPEDEDRDDQDDGGSDKEDREDA
jgi:hypothetical protein